MAGIQVGDVFGDFSLKSHTEAAVDTAQFAGQKILLSFHPLAWTEVCAKQMQSLEARLDDFRNHNTVPLGISVDSAPCKKAWAKNLGIEKVDLLADFWPHGGLAARLGLFIDKLGFSERANIILDEKRKAVFVKVYPLRELPDIQEMMDFLRITQLPNQR
ncbi:MAG: redoxin domain-containing protein [Smithellaceae bacterium]|jgi:peroxiredoxin|nr:redoxin domain-containing protein [Smithellaceae bacterium]MDD3259585.1 redoxin domain-containing protein [Smithellaceae bacterium]MDD3848200.1 redoxin domain-containing protein [Smithellaceae bacterium]HOG13138.1 redoxin domain-containing protein [Smithellaceae bacterium]HPL09768.1 redoxin domain-containing protein [Smithellaceae bacterium]